MTRERDRIQKNANSYIVKNCPAITEYKFPDKAPHKDCCQCTYGYCKNIDCVVKQVIGKCKYYQNKIGRTPQHRAGFVDAANEILQLFDIEEINK